MIDEHASANSYTPLFPLLVILLLLTVGLDISFAANKSNEGVPELITAVIPPDAPPAYFRDKNTGNAAGFAIDIMEVIAKRMGARVRYIFGNGWTEIIGKIDRGEADVIPLMDVSEEWGGKLAYTDQIDSFSVAFFVHSHVKIHNWVPEGRTVGVISSSIAYELLRNRPNIHFKTYESFVFALYDLMAGKIESFACQAPIFLRIAQEAGLEDHFIMIQPPIAVINRAIAVRKDNAAMLDKLNKAMQGLVDSDEYIRIYRKWYGTPTPFWTQGRIVTASAAVILLIITVMAVWRYLTVTKLNRKLADTIASRDQIEDAQRKLSIAVTQSPVSVVITDTEGAIEYVNPKFEQLTGYTAEEVIGKNPRILQSGQTPREVYDQLWETIQAGRSWQGIFCNKKKNGDLYWEFATIAPIISKQGKTINYVAVKEDITERKCAEEALQKSEKRIRDITSSLGEGLYVLNEAGELTFMNPEAERILGWSEAELKDKNVHNYIHNRRPDGSPLPLEECPVINVIKNKSLFVSRDEVFVRKNGSIFPVQIISAPLFDDGRITASVTAFRDITMEKMVEEERIRLIADLQKALAKIKTLYGILPICSYCKKIRDDKGAWKQMESYISEHTDALFSHGMCSECAAKMYPEYYNKLNETDSSGQP